MDSLPGKPLTLLERLSALLSREPEDRGELMALLHSAFERNLLDADALSIIEGTLQMSDLQVSDVMVPRSQMEVIGVDDPMDKIASFVIETGHSRFPTVGESKDDVVGIFLAKDLLRYFVGQEFELRDALRPAVFVPETKRLNVLLRDFRVSRNHMAIVVDEYGGVAGLVTIEDVLEQIVGEIEDEYDSDLDGDNIRLMQDGRYRVKATTEIADFNTAFATNFSDADVDTIGGLVIRALGRLPQRGDTVILADMKFQVLRADSRRVYTLLVEHAMPVADARQA
ncbi:HlyC/CorC family transporter [Aromatoleum bremense]|uniref:Magnesium and cobalt efflux protein CorC n=1 Tax=Aromatoleum bremense TaxID=76115 RepID=A0ABX1NQN3_9RHOO|nr:transporter associated domain-containing protein [Aromatoleum bremense]NMG14274.1 CBS domain-containing protein [Aromatoleum bremense]QTQ31134.1 Putative magnesium and cobalt efflux protein [Aromatoleum bremense]